MATWTTNIPAANKARGDGIQAGLIAAATVLQNEVKSRLRGGYTSGAFVTGNVVNSVTKSEPVQEGAEWSITVGTNVDYALFWELGHHNIFTRKYERVEIWRPALFDTRGAQWAAFARVLKRFTEQ